MTMLSTPTLVNQLTAGGLWPHEDCGEACLKSLLTDEGHPDPITAVEQALGSSGASGTGPQQLIIAGAKLGVSLTEVAVAGEVDAALSRKHRIIVLIPSDVWGNPSPGSGIGHWIEMYGFDGTNYHFMNPLGGRLQAISPATLIECERERGHIALEAQVILPADNGQPAPHPTPPPPPAPHPTPAPANGITWEHFAGTVQVRIANVRSGPSTLFPVKRAVSEGTHLGFDGFTYGQAEYDPVAHRLDRRWFHLDAAHGGGWIASALVNGNPANSHP